MTIITNQHTADVLTDEERRAMRIREEREAQKAHYEAWVTGQDVAKYEAELTTRFDGPWEMWCYDPAERSSFVRPTHKVVNSLGQTVFTFGGEAAARAYADEYHLTVVDL